MTESLFAVFYPGCENMIPPPTSYFCYLRENFLGKNILVEGQWAELPGKFRHFENEKLDFYNNF